MNDSIIELEILHLRDQIQFIPLWGRIAEAQFSWLPKDEILKKYKAPINVGWQEDSAFDSPTDILTSLPLCNIGMISGPISDGICILDFDSSEGWEFFTKQFGIDILPMLDNTVCWQSGKSKYRRQYAFKIQREFFDLLKYKSINSLEFRFANRQSAMPPSIHPETQQEYYFRNKPSEYEIKQLPIDILMFWIEQSIEEEPIPFTGDLPQDYYDEVLNKVKQFYPILEYEMWWKVISSTVESVGESNAVLKLKQLWPEKTKGEYMRKINDIKNKKISPGYIVNLSKGIK